MILNFLWRGLFCGEGCIVVGEAGRNYYLLPVGGLGEFWMDPACGGGGFFPFVLNS